jgi:hypothetical protein
MIKKNSLVFATIASWILLLIFPFNISGQFKIGNIEKIKKIKNGITYVAMNDPDLPASKEFIEMYKQNWTISKIEFIKYTDIQKNISEGSFFLTIAGYGNSIQSARTNYDITHLYLELWTCTDEYFKKKNKDEFSYSDQVQIARTEIYTDFNTLYNPSILFESNYDGNGHIRNWGLGILKNYVQKLMLDLNKGKTHDLYDSDTENKKLKVLKKQILYVPDFVLIEFNKFNGDESRRHKEKDIFDDYKHQFQVLPTKDLNEKILKSDEDFYYLIYIKSSTDKFINIIHSKTGEVIYSKYTPLSYNLKSRDLKNLSNNISSY